MSRNTWKTIEPGDVVGITTGRLIVEDVIEVPDGRLLLSGRDARSGQQRSAFCGPGQPVKVLRHRRPPDEF